MSDVNDSLRDLIGSQVLNEYHRATKDVTFEGAPAAAVLSTTLTGSNNDLDFTAEQQGKAGNDTTVQYRDPGALSQSLSVSVADKAIVVNLATGAGTNEQQTITVNATGGFFVVAFRDQTSGKIAYNATAAQVQAVLEGLSTIGTGNVAVTGSAGGPYTVTFQGALAATNVPALTARGINLKPSKPHIQVVESVKGTGSVDEVQKVRIQGATRGTFTLTFSGQTTSALAYNVSAANMLTALQALSNWNDSAGAVTKSGSEYTITFSGTGLTHTDQPLLTASATGMQPTIAVATTVPGVAYAITTTAAQIITAIRASDAADALVAVANKAANDGTGVVTALAATNLTGGKSGVGSIAAQATASTNLTGANNDLDYTAVPTGEAGNGITVTYVDPGGVTAALSVTVDVQERAITVNLARAASAITSTAAQVKAAIDALPAAAALVTVANKATNDGTGIVTAMSAMTLGSGAAGGHGLIDLFNIDGQVTAALILVCTTDLAGASATLKAGPASSAAGLIPVVTATAVDKGLIVDKSGVVAAGTIPNTTPHQPLTDGEKVSITPATAAITGGAITAILFYQKLGVDSRVRAAA